MASLYGTTRTRRNVSWAAFEKYLASKGERSNPRVTYLDGVLELVTPTQNHDQKESWIGSLVEMYAIERDIPLSAYGHWTLRDKLKQAGAEPDGCYIVGDDDRARRRKRPNFVIEVQWSRRGLDKLEVYKRLGVREVWFWPQAASGAGIDVHILRRGVWKIVPRSPSLPDLDLDLLCSFLDRWPMTTAMREFRIALAAS